MEHDFLEKLNSSVDRLNDLVNRHFAVQKDIFQPSLRKILPIPGFHRPVNYEAHIIELKTILVELDNELTAAYGFKEELYVAYLGGVKAAVYKLAEISDKMVKKGKEFNYPKSESDRDFDEYLELVKVYSGICGQMTEILKEMS